MRLAVLACVLACKSSTPPDPAPTPEPAKPDPKAEAAAKKKKLVDRAKALELPTTAEPVPGDPMSHHAAGYAKMMCSAVFITGLELEFAKEHVGYFTAPYNLRKQLDVTLDRDRKRVMVKPPSGPTRTAVLTTGQGCVVLGDGDKLAFTPTAVTPKLPPAETPWPLGDKVDAFPAELDKTKIQAAVDAAFEGDGETAAFVVVWRGKLVGERYAPGITHATPLESWSMGKSVLATLMGVLIQQGVYKLDQPAPVPEWQTTPNDPRAKIRIEDLFRMSSGLRIVAPQDPEWTGGDNWNFDGGASYPGHVYLYTGAIDTYRYAATRPLQWPPNTVGRYRNTDPVLLGYLVRLAVEKRGEPYHAFPQRALFDKIGVRNAILETDPYGNFLHQGYQLISARDWARIGQLYVTDGIAPSGERLLPEGFVKFVSTPAPAWDEPRYGGLFWLVAKDKGGGIAMQGSGGQFVIISPEHDLVVVRLGHFRGGRKVGPSFEKAMQLVRAALPKK